jgi:cell division septation protein DedD
MHNYVTRVVFALAAVACFTQPCEAQSGTAVQPPPLPASDSIFRRARRLVSEGNGAAGRALVDSMVRAAEEGTPGYGDAIFWRGALSETAADAERDYRRVIVEYPLSPYADDALLSLAELEQARGDRTAAFQHLQRFVREHPVSPARARAGLAAARLAFEQRDMGRGCTMIADARSSAGSSDVELRNQIEYYGARCPTGASASETGTGVVASGAPSVATTSATTPPTPAASPVSRNAKAVSEASTERKGAAPAKAVTGRQTPPKAESVKKTAPKAEPAKASQKSEPLKAPSRKSVPAKSDSAVARTTPAEPHGSWTIQLAAYNTRPDAERLIAKLAGRGVKARISGATKPYRVRLDYYKTRQDATTAVAELKARGIIGFVTEEAKPSAGSTP